MHDSGGHGDPDLVRALDQIRSDQIIPRSFLSCTTMQTRGQHPSPAPPHFTDEWTLGLVQEGGWRPSEWGPLLCVRLCVCVCVCVSECEWTLAIVQEGGWRPSE